MVNAKAPSYRSFIHILYSEQLRVSLLIRTNLSIQSAPWLSTGRLSRVTTWHLTPTEVKINSEKRVLLTQAVNMPIPLH